MWTLNSSTRVPSKTVRPMPTMPAVMSSSGMIGAPARSGPDGAARQQERDERAA